ncbi:hypothetical protein, partial [Aeromonas sanarellii]
MMEAFVVFTREETSDPHALATYSAGVGPSFDGHDVTFLVNQHRKMTRVQRPKLTRVSWLISSS